MCFCAVSSELFLACSRFAVGPLCRFLSTPSEATRTYISFKGMILRLQEKYGKNLAAFLLRPVDKLYNYTLTTFVFLIFFPAVPRDEFLSFIYYLRAMRTKISFKGMTLRLRQEKYRKNLAVFRCYDLGRQIVITR